MASPTPVMPFLRPLGLPQASTVRHFLRFSTSASSHYRPTHQPRQDVQTSSTPLLPPKIDSSLAASRRASPSYPPPSFKSLPRPKESRASRRTSHPTKQRPYPTRQPSHHQPTPQKLVPEAVELLPPEKSAPNLAYFVTRTASKELPIYAETSRGGNRKTTRVKKIDGKATVLRDELRKLLGVAGEDAIVNSVTGHINIKGHHKTAIAQFLRERRF